MEELNASLPPNAAPSNLHILKRQKAELQETLAHLATTLIPLSNTKSQSITHVTIQMNDIAEKIKALDQLIEGQQPSQSGPSSHPVPPAHSLTQREIDGLRSLLANDQNARRRLTDLEEFVSRPITIPRFVPKERSHGKRIGSEDGDFRGRFWYTMFDNSRHVPKHCLYQSIRNDTKSNKWHTLREISRSACGVQELKGRHGSHIILPEYEEEHVLEVIEKVEQYSGAGNKRNDDCDYFIRSLFKDESISRPSKRHHTNSRDTTES
ncbi:hypothetical protein BJ741DRAFT_583687 [Chytriomyces cf. hyalinus JEL632]|nr:hypothetical protein BJ741DRAFT_583687 [Chytriomyces cf. hyalinus JEL632]